MFVLEVVAAIVVGIARHSFPLGCFTLIGLGVVDVVVGAVVTMFAFSQVPKQ